MIFIFWLIHCCQLQWWTSCGVKYISLNTSLDIKTAILKVSVPVSISGCNPENLNISLIIKTVILKNLDSSLDIRTAILKVSIPVSVSRLQSWESRYQSQYPNGFFQKSQSWRRRKNSLAHHCHTQTDTVRWNFESMVIFHHVSLKADPPNGGKVMTWCSLKWLLGWVNIVECGYSNVWSCFDLTRLFYTVH